VAACQQATRGDWGVGMPHGHENHHPVTATLFEHLGWIAAPGATMAAVVAHMQ